MKHISGSWQDTTGNWVANGLLHLKLNQDAVAPATSQAVPREVSFLLDQNGSIPPGSQIWCNDELLPSTTYYTVTVTALGGGLVWGPANLQITGADPINLNTLVPLPGIAGLNVTPAQTVVFTRPPLQAGVIGQVHDISTSASSAFITVSDQFVLAAASGASIIASKSLDSMTASVIVSLDSDNFPVFSAAALGSTATNQIVLVGGNNVTLVNATNPSGMTVTFNAAAGGAGGGGSFYGGISGGNTVGQSGSVSNQLILAGGNNVTLSGASNNAGMTVTISGGTLGAGGGQVGIAAVGPGSIVGAPSGSTIITNRMMLVPANNITFYTNTDASNMSVFISASSALAASVGIVAAGGSVQGFTGSSIQPNHWQFLAGPNITLSAATDVLSNLSLMIQGASGGAGGGGSVNFFQGPNITISSTTNASGTTASFTGPSPTAATGAFSAGMSGGGAGSMVGTGWVTPSGVGVSNVLRLVAGSNITLSGLTGSVSTGVNAGQALTITINAGGGPYLEAGISGGNTSGITGTVSNQLVFAGGNNITLSGSTDVNGMTATISGAAGGPGGSFSAGISGSNAVGTTGTVSNQFVLAGGNNITLSGSTNASGMTATVIGAAGGTGGASFSAGISGGNTSGNTGTVNNQLVLAGGNNITLSGSTNVAGMTVTVSAQSLNLSVLTAGGGTATGVALVSLNNLRLAPGSNVLLSQNGQSITINAQQPTTTFFQGGISGFVTQTSASASIMGNTGMVSNQLVLAAGSFITLSGSTDVNGMSVSVNAAPDPGAFYIAPGAGSVDGNTSILRSASLQLVAGSNIHFSGSTNTTGMTVTIDASAATAAGFSGGISGGNTSGNSGTVSNQFVLAGGNNITVSGSTNASGMTATISGQAMNMALITGGAGSVINAGQVSLNAIRFAAGSNVTLSQSAQSITINAGSVAAAGNSRYLANAWPIMPSYTTISDWQVFGVAPIFWPTQPAVGSNYGSANVFFYFNQPGAGTAYGSLNVSLGIYTRTGSTLSQVSSGSNTYRWTLSHGVNDTLYGNLKMLKIPIVGSANFDARDYWMGFVLGTTSSSQSFGLSVLGVQMRSGDMAGEFGVATAASWQQVPGWGLYTTGSTLPTSLGFSDLEGSAGTDQRAPLVYLAGFTA